MNATSRQHTSSSRDAILMRVLLISVVVLLMLVTFLAARYAGSRRGRERARQEIEQNDTLRAPAVFLKAVGEGSVHRF